MTKDSASCPCFQAIHVLPDSLGACGSSLPSDTCVPHDVGGEVAKHPVFRSYQVHEQGAPLPAVLSPGMGVEAELGTWVGLPQCSPTAPKATPMDLFDSSFLGGALRPLCSGIMCGVQQPQFTASTLL